MTHAKPSQDLTHSPLTGEVIDLDLGAMLVGKDRHFAKEMLKLLVNSFPQEIKAIQDAHHHQDWQAIQDIAHKMRGGTSYCGTPRLKLAATQLENYLKNGETQERENLLQVLFSEMNAVQLAFEKL